MKRFKILSLIAVAVLITFSACEKIDPPYKEHGEIEFTGQNILLEDYTGHTCVNCPTAAVIAHELKELYGEHLIIIAVHAGSFAIPHPGDYENDYRTETGNIWNTFFGIQQYPSGLVNRIQNSSGNYPIAYDKWGTMVADELKKIPQAEISISNSFASGVLTTSVTTKFLAEMESTYSLYIGITEDSIISAQKNFNSNIGDTPQIDDYVFMHMLRGSVNGEWGEDIFGDAIEVDKEYKKTYQYTITGDPDNSHVVAFVYDNETKSVIQVVEKPVK